MMSGTTIWRVFEAVEKSNPNAVASNELTKQVRELPVTRVLKTAVGKGRAWIRLGLNARRLSDAVRELVASDPALLREQYEPWAVVSNEEGMVFAGLTRHPVLQV